MIHLLILKKSTNFIQKEISDVQVPFNIKEREKKNII